MKYKEFTANIDGLEKKLGILGEIHTYTKKESELARQIVKEYDLIASEGTDSDSEISLGAYFKVLPAFLLDIPASIAYNLATNRSSENHTTKDIAKENHIKLIRFNDSDIPLLRAFTMTLICAISIPLVPIDYINYKINGDPDEVGTRAYNIIENNILRQKVWLPILKYSANVHNRDKIMADKSVELISAPKNDNLLINCGQGHFEGIINNLYEKLELKETGKYIHI